MMRCLNRSYVLLYLPVLHLVSRLTNGDHVELDCGDSDDCSCITALKCTVPSEGHYLTWQIQHDKQKTVITKFMLNAGKKNDELKVKLVAGVKFYGVLDVTDIDKGFTSILTFDCSSVTEGARISCRYSNGTYGEQKVLEKKKCCSISNSTSYASDISDLHIMCAITVLVTIMITLIVSFLLIFMILLLAIKYKYKLKLEITQARDTLITQIISQMNQQSSIHQQCTLPNSSSVYSTGQQSIHSIFQLVNNEVLGPHINSETACV